MLEQISHDVIAEEGITFWDEHDLPSRVAASKLSCPSDRTRGGEDEDLWDLVTKCGLHDVLSVLNNSSKAGVVVLGPGDHGGWCVPLFAELLESNYERFRVLDVGEGSLSKTLKKQLCDEFVLAGENLHRFLSMNAAAL